MSVGNTHISQMRRTELTERFQCKVDALRDIVKAREWAAGPARPSLTKFCEWSSDELSVEPISYSAIYKDVDEYNRLRGEAEKLLKALRIGRAGGTPSGRKTVTSLTNELAVTRQLSQSFLDQLTMLRVQLETERAEVLRLRGDLNSSRATRGKVVPIKKMGESNSRRSQK